MRLSDHAGALLFSGALLCVFQANAAPIVSGVQIESDSGGCTLLAHPVRLFLSRGVKGAYVCNDATNVIGLAFCHPAGKRYQVLTSGEYTSDGVVYTARSTGGDIEDVAGCPVGDLPLSDDIVPDDIP